MFGLFKRYDVHMCPEVKGQIFDNGKPMVGVEIKRQLIYVPDKKELNDTVVTDGEGRFSFEKVVIRSRSPGSVFTQSNTFQKIFLLTSSNDYVLWESVFWGYSENKFYNEKLKKLSCDIKNKKIRFHFNLENAVPIPAVGICRWEDDFRPSDIQL